MKKDKKKIKNLKFVINHNENEKKLIGKMFQNMKNFEFEILGATRIVSISRFIFIS